MEILVIALVCGVGSSAIANAKNRSGLGYGLLGFLVPIIGLLIAIGMPAKAAPIYMEGHSGGRIAAGLLLTAGVVVTLGLWLIPLLMP